MANLPEKTQQVLYAHGEFIRRVAAACQNVEQRQALEPILQQSAANGWTDLVAVVRRLFNGERDASLLKPLDEEDRLIIDAVLQTLQDPSWLERHQAKPNAGFAAPGLAMMIRQAASGDAQALQLIADMAEQMSAAGGDMARLAAVMRRLVNGERDLDTLSKGMGAQGEQLLQSLVGELEQQAH